MLVLKIKCLLFTSKFSGKLSNQEQEIDDMSDIDYLFTGYNSDFSGSDNPNVF